MTTAAMNYNDQHEIKTMKLYHHVDRIERRLRDLGYSPTDDEARIDPEQLGTMDSLHYFGDEPIQRILALLQQPTTDGDASSNRKSTALKQAANKKVLDIGTGYGGTARLLAHRSGCRVDALELQSDLSAAGQVLTRKCGLEALVQHKTGDFLELPVATDTYNVVVGLMCFMHIQDWSALFSRCFASLQPGGVVYVEDLFLRGNDTATLSPADAKTLRDDIYCTHLYTRTQLLALLERCGFEIVAFNDVTAKWHPYVVARHATYRANLARHIAYDGQQVAEKLDHFYASVAQVFEGGSVGGFTLVVRKPLDG